MEKSIRKSIIVGLVCSLLAFATVVAAVNYNVVVQWTIPSDLGITITYPTGKSQIEFAPTGKTFANQSAVDQTTVVAALNISGAGNTNILVKFNLTGTAPTGMTFFNTSKLGTGNPHQYWWTNVNWTTQQTVIASLAVGTYQRFWAYSSGTDIASGVVSRNLYINTTAA